MFNVNRSYHPNEENLIDHKGSLGSRKKCDNCPHCFCRGPIRSRLFPVLPVSGSEDPVLVYDVAPAVPPCLVFVVTAPTETNLSVHSFLPNEGHEWELSFFCRLSSNDLKKTVDQLTEYYSEVVQSLSSTVTVRTPQVENSKLSSQLDCKSETSVPPAAGDTEPLTWCRCPVFSSSPDSPDICRWEYTARPVCSRCPRPHRDRGRRQ